MRNTTEESPHPGPPQDRLWTEEDLAIFLGFRSIGELINRHSDFPRPVPLLMQGRRWRSSDVVSWVNHLCDNPGSTPASDETVIPDIDINTINQLLEEALNVTTR
jgi:predicted DNA-binding transcriptional regulator AlpA